MELSLSFYSYRKSHVPIDFLQIKPTRNSILAYFNQFTNLKTWYFVIFPLLQKHQIAIMFLLNPADGYSVLQYISSHQKYGIVFAFLAIGNHTFH